MGERKVQKKRMRKFFRSVTGKKPTAGDKKNIRKVARANAPRKK